MDRIRDQGGTGLLAAHLARLGTDTTWKDGPSSTTIGRLVDATLHSLTTPPSTPVAPASRVRVLRALRSRTLPCAVDPWDAAFQRERVADLRSRQVKGAADACPGESQGRYTTRPSIVRPEQQRRYNGRANRAFVAPSSTRSWGVRPGQACTQINSTPFRKGIPQRALRRGQHVI